MGLRTTIFKKMYVYIAQIWTNASHFPNSVISQSKLASPNFFLKPLQDNEEDINEIQILPKLKRGRKRDSAPSDDEEHPPTSQDPPKPKLKKKRATSTHDAAPPANMKELAIQVITLPCFQDDLAKPDLLRTPMMVARSIANLAKALCLRSSDIQPLWTTYANQNNTSTKLKENAALKTCMAAAKKYFACDESSDRRITLSTAKQDYRLTDKDLVGIDYRAVKNPHYRSAAPMRLYNELEIRELSLKKFGSHDGLTAAIEKSRLRSEKLAFNKRLMFERAREKARAEAQRREEIRVRLHMEHGIPNNFLLMDALEECTAYIMHENSSHMDESLAAIVARFKVYDDKKLAAFEQRYAYIREIKQI